MKCKRLLVVEDERIIAEDIKRTLNNFGYDVIDIVSTGAKAIYISELENPDLILMDINLEGNMNGVEAAEKIHSEYGIPIVYLTAYADDKTLNKAKLTEPFGYILKPFEDRELHATIEMAFYKSKMEKALIESEKFLRKVIDTDPNCIFVKDINGQYLMVNKATASLYGVIPANMIGKTDFYFSNKNIINKELAERFKKTDCELVQNNLPKLIIEEDFSSKNSVSKHFQISKVPLKHKNNPNCILGVAVDITKRIEFEHKLTESNRKLKRLLEETVNGLVSAVEMRDPYTAGHQRRVSKLACAIATDLGFDDDRIDGIRMAGLLHDIGKMYIPAEILTKPGQLSEVEFNLIKIHPKAGYDILKKIEFPWPIAQFVLQHHEMINGTGYPNKLAENEIEFESRILSVADVVESMSSHRPYRATLGIIAALDQIKKNRSILYDKDVVDVCVQLFSERDFVF